MTMTDNQKHLDQQLLEKLASALIRDTWADTNNERSAAITAYATLRLAIAIEQIAADADKLLS
jgi:hypothetical protein